MGAEDNLFPGVGQRVDEEADVGPPDGYDGHQVLMRLDAQSVICTPPVASERSDLLSPAATAPASAPGAPCRDIFHLPRCWLRCATNLSKRVLDQARRISRSPTSSLACPSLPPICHAQTRGGM
eukprot:6246171-Pyramimonas_sp.AAC.1